jgi:hypothetical protein
MTYADVNNEHNKDVIFDRRRLYSFEDLRSKKLMCGSETRLVWALEIMNTCTRRIPHMQVQHLDTLA